jgi:hypothetical protein
VPENWEVQSGGSFVGYGSTVRFTGSNTSTITVPASGADFYTIEVTKDVGDVGVMLLSDATAAHALFLTQGIFDLNGFVLSLPGVCTFTGGGGTTDWGTTTNWDCDGSPRLPVAIDFAHIPSPQTVVVAGTGGPMDAHMPVGSLTVDNGATLQLSGALDVSGTSTNAGTISLSTGTMNFSGGAAATFVNTGSIVSTLAGTLRVDALFTNSGSVDFSVGGTLRLMRAFSGGGSLDLSGATLILDGDGYQLPTAATLIENLTVSSGLSTAVGYIQADTTITGVLTLETFIDLQSNTLTLSGSGSIVSSVDSNGNFYTNTGTLRFTGSGDQTITAPVWVSEFGTCHTGEDCIDGATGQGLWFAGIRQYLREADIDWAYWAYWAWNGTQARGTSRTYGEEETYGVLDRTWQKPALPALQAALGALQAATEHP